MNTIEAIMQRISTRSFSEQVISDDDMHTLLAAAMSGPSCANTRDWSFIVLRDREIIDRVADGNGPYVGPLRKASAAVLVCGDCSRSYENARDYWIIDGAIAAQNLILAATELGIGSCWIGTYPEMERVEAQIKLFDLPEHIVPHSVIALGYPDEIALNTPGRAKYYEEDRVHLNKW